jgi:hypothetical protein
VRLLRVVSLRSFVRLLSVGLGLPSQDTRVLSSKGGDFSFFTKVHVAHIRCPGRPTAGVPVNSGRGGTDGSLWQSNSQRDLPACLAPDGFPVRAASGGRGPRKDHVERHLLFPRRGSGLEGSTREVKRAAPPGHCFLSSAACRFSP